MGRNSKYDEETKLVSVRLPLSTIAYYTNLGGTLADGFVAAEKILRADTPPVVDSARTEGLEKLAARESGVGVPVSVAQGNESMDWMVKPRPPHPVYVGEGHGRTLPPIYQGGEDVTPRFKGEKGRKTGSIFPQNLVMTGGDDGLCGESQETEL